MGCGKSSMDFTKSVYEETSCPKSDERPLKTFYADDITKILFSEEEIAKKVEELGAKISMDYEGKDLVVVGMLQGAYMFFSDLVKQINLPCHIDLMRVKSYSGTSSTGKVRLLKDLSCDPKDKHILIAEDLIDTGATLKWLKKHFESKECASVKLCCLLDKITDKRVDGIFVDYVGFHCADEFVIGYGMDYNETYRNIPCVAVLAPHVYECQSE